METGMRGFLLAGKTNFLEPYEEGKIVFSTLIKELSNTVSDNPGLIKLLQEIDKTISDWQSNITEPMIALRGEVGQTKTMDDIAYLVRQAKGKVYFDRFRGQIKTFKDREISLMAKRMDALESTESLVINTTIFGTLFAIVIGIFVALGLTKHVMELLGGEPKIIEKIVKQIAQGDLSKQFNSNTVMTGILAEMKNMTIALQSKVILAEKIADGELNHHVELASENDSLGLALQAMSLNLNNVLLQNNLASDEISLGSSNISESSILLSDGVSQQSVALETIVSSLSWLLKLPTMLSIL
jgi:methyl-accepting chemotaxis protein